MPALLRSHPHLGGPGHTEIRKCPRCSGQDPLDARPHGGPYPVARKTGGLTLPIPELRRTACSNASPLRARESRYMALSSSVGLEDWATAGGVCFGFPGNRRYPAVSLFTGYRLSRVVHGGLKSVYAVQAVVL